MFQFLDRNSFGSDSLDASHSPTAVCVSIPRSEFFRFGLKLIAILEEVLEVSIPRSEFFRFGRRSGCQYTSRYLRFNSSIGILSVRTSPGRCNRALTASFNSSIGILSVRTRFTCPVTKMTSLVSIPRSEFFRFGRNGLGYPAELQRLVSIPRSEFFRFGRVRYRGDHRLCSCFNSSIGILSVRTVSDFMTRAAEISVSIPRSEFFRFGRRQSVPCCLCPFCFNSSIGILSVRT